MTIERSGTCGTTANCLYFGDCLEVMREDIADESVDLIYLDPPFNSKRIHNASIGGAQWVAFDDTWPWHDAVDDFRDISDDVELAGTMEGLRCILGEGPTLGYLSYMTNRLRECRRVLKPTGSIYLHCDPTMSHYIKVVMDRIFGHANFRNEIVWCYKSRPQPKNHFGRKHDILLFYSKSQQYVFNYKHVMRPLADATKAKYKHMDDQGNRFRLQGRGIVGSPIRSAKDVPLHWEKDRPDLVVRDYLNQYKGVVLEDFWVDIGLINQAAKERLGYPTQKPVALLDRIIRASSNAGDIVLDPFCGCGTTVHAAQILGRRWIGIDVCINACKVTEKRLGNHLDSLWSDMEFIGMPKTRDDAKTLASLNMFRFERWAASLVDGMEANKRQRGAKGIDGRGRIPIRKGKFIDMVSQVKGGDTGPGDVLAFNNARQQAKADLGVFTCFEDRVTPPMRTAAASAGQFMNAPALQIYTVEDYFEGRKPALPLIEMG